ncbi:hypothetical protein FACS1894145_0540 [Bacteroidia bacterium]|nr:hypothetical protein FACS1894145_0540 [Bacteroidia bacterium]
MAKISVVANFATTSADGKTYIVDYYNIIEEYCLKMSNKLKNTEMSKRENRK